MSEFYRGGFLTRPYASVDITWSYYLIAVMISGVHNLTKILFSDRLGSCAGVAQR